MLVYRITNENEVNNILNYKSFDNIGKKYNINPLLNTHQYDNNKKYIHFYKDFYSIFYLESKKRKYICTYDISEEILNKYSGIGYYLDNEMLRIMQKVDEYAIDIDLMNFDYLKKIEKITDEIDLEDYLYDEYYDKIDIVYDSNCKNRILKI